MCSAYLSRIAVWHVDKFEFPLHAQGVYHDLPGRSPVMGAAGRRDPQHFHRMRTSSGPLCTRHPHVCAQKACCCAVAAKICGRPIRPCRHCSRDGAAPSLVGEHTDGLASARGRGRCRSRHVDQPIPRSATVFGQTGRTLQARGHDRVSATVSILARSASRPFGGELDGEVIDGVSQVRPRGQEPQVHWARKRKSGLRMQQMSASLAT